jgi:hypothetical protein
MGDGFYKFFIGLNIGRNIWSLVASLPGPAPPEGRDPFARLRSYSYVV